MPDATVLVVDDSQITRAVIGRRLREAGFEVVEAVDGVEGAVAAYRIRPAVVVTDLEMPLMDGCQLARLLKNDPLTSDIPVVILTTHREAASRFWGESAGADAYLVKDDVERDLVATVERLAGNGRTPAAAGDEPPAGSTAILGRVARQLDRGLLEATVVTRVLREGVEAETLDAASTSILQVFSRIADAELLGLGITDDRSLHLYLLRPERATSRVDVEQVADHVMQRLGLDGDVDLVVRLDGEAGGAGPALDLETALVYPLVLRQARGVVLVWPFGDPQEDWGPSASLIEPAVPHAGLVLDSARLADHLRRLSTHDGLTRLLNHRSVLERLDEEIARAQRYRSSVTVALCDLDRFKRLNDRFGHLVGDEVLREFAVRLRSSVRISDVVGRYGGEEFLLVLPNTGLADGAATIGRLCEALVEHPMELPSVADPVAVTASFGVASLREVDGDRTAERLLSLADERLYSAKREGRARVVSTG